MSATDNEKEERERERRKYGVPVKEGLDRADSAAWEAIKEFISSGEWDHATPCTAEDEEDELVREAIPYGRFMLGFDFHLTPHGPKLIEINTNAGGLAAVFSLTQFDEEKAYVRERFVKALLKEYGIGVSHNRGGTLSDCTTGACANGGCAAGACEVYCKPIPLPSAVAIVDDDVRQQGMYSEMLTFAGLLKDNHVPCYVVSPEELQLREDGLYVAYDAEAEAVKPRSGEDATPSEAPSHRKVEFVYNRLTDFRLTHPSHAHLRRAAVDKKVVLSPHPAAYSRVADKRNLLRTSSDVIPASYVFSDKPLEEWAKTKKRWVFKPSSGAGSKGVYRGDKLSKAKLAKLPPDTIVQEFAEPAVSDDGSKQDLRVYTRARDILGLTTRHFTGQVMEMRSSRSGFRAVLPEGVCCFPILVLNDSLDDTNPDSMCTATE